MTDTVIYERNGAIGRLLLNIPERHNALGEEQLLAIQQVLAVMEAADDRPRVLVISGAGDKTFCAGAALNELGGGRISGELFQQTTDRIAELPIPTLAAINGNVFGGGVELALSCDFRIGVEGSRLRVPAAAIGLCYPVGGIRRFVERLGVSAAKRLLLAAETLDSDAMLALGFLDYRVRREQLAERTTELAENLAGLAPLSLRAMKAIIAGSASRDLDEAEAEALAASCRESQDLAEGFAAQREKRLPRFTGH